MNIKRYALGRYGLNKFEIQDLFLGKRFKILNKSIGESYRELNDLNNPAGIVSIIPASRRERRTK